MLVELIRLIVVLACTAGGYALGQTPFALRFGSAESAKLIVTALGAFSGYLAGGLIARTTDRALTHAEGRIAQRHASEVLAAVLGALLGLTISALVCWPLIVFIPVESVAYPLSAFILVVLTSLAIRVTVRKRMELFGVLGVAPSDAAGGTGGCLLDSSAAIDGRIIGLWKAGILPSPLCVPAFIIWELQGIADSGDPLRRRRGQRGLDVLTSLREAGAYVRVLEEDPAGTNEPDAKLIVVARRRGMPIVTSDSNLAKAAELQGLRVLSLHALTDLLRPPVSIGQQASVQLVKEGRERGQAVGYLDDGTMVVVERATHALGSVVEVEVTSVLQTASGRMLFAKMGTPAVAPVNEA